MNTFSTALCAAALLAAASASAQTEFGFGLRGGANRAGTTVDGANNSDTFQFTRSTEKSSLYGWQVGVALEARFGKLAFQPALVFSQKGDKLHATSSDGGVAGYSYSETTSTNRYNWLEIPLNVAYTLHGDHGLQVFAGPYVAAAVGGRQRGNANGYSTVGYPRTGAYSEDFDAPASFGPGTSNHRWDAGFNLGVGYRQGPLQVQLGYGLGLLNLHRANDGFTYQNFNTSPAYNRTAQLTATYFVSH